jgi:hypothetical protein
LRFASVIAAAATMLPGRLAAATSKRKMSASWRDAVALEDDPMSMSASSGDCDCVYVLDPCFWNGYSIGFPGTCQGACGWCWAACATSVGNFYDGMCGSRGNFDDAWTLCDVVTATLVAYGSDFCTDFDCPDCCTDSCTGACDTGFESSYALCEVGHYGGTDSSVSYSTIYDQMCAGQPAIAELNWWQCCVHGSDCTVADSCCGSGDHAYKQQLAHAVVMCGAGYCPTGEYDDSYDDPMVLIFDPAGCSTGWYAFDSWLNELIEDDWGDHWDANWYQTDYSSPTNISGC